MRFEQYSFGSIQIDGVSYDHDLVVDRGKIRKRKKRRPRDSATRMDIPRFRWWKRFLGGVASW